MSTEQTYDLLDFTHKAAPWQKIHGMTVLRLSTERNYLGDNSIISCLFSSGTSSYHLTGWNAVFLKLYRYKLVCSLDWNISKSLVSSVKKAKLMAYESQGIHKHLTSDHQPTFKSLFNLLFISAAKWYSSSSEQSHSENMSKRIISIDWITSLLVILWELFYITIHKNHRKLEIRRDLGRSASSIPTPEQELKCQECTQY